MTIETGPNRQRIVAVPIHATISTMSMAGMGLMGLVAGASTAGALGMVRLVADTWFPWMTAHSEQKHQLMANLHAQRADAVARWRAGLASGRDDYRQWAACPRDHDPPNVVGDEWFEGLRPHLPDTGGTAKYRNAHEISCDNQTVVLLSLEIGRVEKQWMNEAKSYPRRARN
jgi:hypothetical protein